ncbi:MAG TPA: AMP-binding protein [Mycobacteriales bacterium]|nr:AMP-binding protein [Mycobacteriales bacterium]
MVDAAGRSFGRALTELASARPDQANITLIAPDGTETDLSWAVLEARANQIAHRFAELGVTKDAVVALALPTCAEHILVTLAIWKLGAVLLPLRHDMPSWEMDRLLSLAEPTILVSDSHEASIPVLTRDDLARTAELDDRPLPDVVPDCVNYVASSGSTGSPKLIVTPRRGVVGADPDTAFFLSSGPATALVVSPLYHVNGFAFAAPFALEGARVYVLEKFDAALAVDVIERHRITLTVMVPTMLQRIARLSDIGTRNLRSLTRLVYGGAKVPDWVVDRWLELIDPAAFLFTYGSSERLGFVAMTGLEWPEHRGSTGKPMDCRISIRDPDGRELPTGETGEIFLRSLEERPVFQYIGMPTPEPSADGYRSLGDLGWLDSDGYLYIADRRTDMIVSGGANVFPAEVEEALSEHPDVVDQVVVPVPDQEWGHRVHAIVQPRDPEQPPPPAELRAWCKARLAAYKAPRTFEFVARMPRTEAGKLNRTALGTQRADRDG